MKGLTITGVVLTVLSGCGSPPPIDYAAEVAALAEEAWQYEPLIRLRKFIIERGDWDDDQEAALLEDCAKRVEVAVETYLGTPKAPPEHMFDYMYETLPEVMDEQRDIGVKYAGRGGGQHG